MTTITDAFGAGVDAVIADNGLNKAGFRDAIKTVATGSSNSEVSDWIDAIAAQYAALGIINNPTYGNLRNEIVNEGEAVAKSLFMALDGAIGGLPETLAIFNDLRRVTLRAERDEVNTSIDTIQGFKTGATRQVKEALDLGIANLREYKEIVKTELKSLGESSP